MIALFGLLWAATSFAQDTKPPKVFDLNEALHQNLVSLSVEGLGGYHGESLKLQCKNLAGRFLRIRIPIGQLMVPADSSEQTLVVAVEQTLSVGAKTPVETTLKTFCTEAGDLSPSKGSVFSAGALAPVALCSLLRYIFEKEKTDLADAQAAVWCMTGKEHGLPSIGDYDLARYTAELKGIKPPEYKIHYQMEEVPPGRPADLGKALVLEGNFIFKLEKDEITRMVLLDANGDLVKQLSKDETMKAGEHHSGMRLEVYNLPGKQYTMRLQTKAGQVIKDWDIEL